MDIKNYLRDKITGWYKNAELDYGVTGRFISAAVIGNDLKIVWEEMGEQLETVIAWFQEHSAEQLYNVWMEG